MANTRNCVTAKYAKNNGEDNNQDTNPPPPPPPTLEQVLAMQAQILQTMEQTMVNLHAQPHALTPTFSHAVEPIDVDDWLKSIEKKLQVV
jgi:hypothetical protein